MDSKSRQKLSIYRFQQAKETLELAQYCLEHGYYRDAINRSYYAALYAVKAVLALDCNKYVSELLQEDTKRKLAKMQQTRIKSDYDDFFMTERGKVEEQVEYAKYIVEEVKNLLKQQKRNDK